MEAKKTCTVLLLVCLSQAASAQSTPAASQGNGDAYSFRMAVDEVVVTFHAADASAGEEMSVRAA